ncbi:unnamed protein product [Diatraea saccharalis]|uniref:Glucose-methanol-choline oxidoreductase N-terminal domain-containing protein n=1 Tax=Diatraea saccharalis TaxID=40085 RepID=A0A9N9WG18_9NEOP|nr:unnamed protein product [Diatraea saccharalis]
MDTLVSNITATCPLAFSGSTGYLFASAIAAVVAAHCAIFDGDQWPEDNAPQIINTGPKSYDFIIVGAGTAGSALAGRLASLDSKLTVLLIEAGDNPSLNSEIPAFFIYNHDIDWKYETISHGACLGFKNNKCIWNKGRTMGGSSSFNAMLYVRGHPRDYQQWEDMGNVGWGYDDLLPFFKMIEERLNMSSYVYNDNPWYTLLEESYNEFGIKFDKSDNNEGVIGTRITKLLTQKGKRLNTGKHYLRQTKNLYVMKNCLVERVIVDHKSKIATAVVVRHKSDIIMEIKANKEVILSAGSIATPQILMLSGIGPKRHLNDIGIECLLDLPVGKNLQDHVIFPLFYKTRQGTQISYEKILLSLLQYMLTKTGPLSHIGLTDFMAFIDTKNASQYPDIQYHHLSFTKNDKIAMRSYLETYQFRDEIIEIIQQLNQDGDLLGIYPTLLHPKSRGEIWLSGPNITSRPIIITNYFDDPDDMKTLLRAIDFARKLEKSERFQSLKFELTPLRLWGCTELPLFTEEYWECYIRHIATTVYHPVGTAKMGTEEDRTAVVGNNLLVHGMQNLRVVDASIMPIIPGGNTMAPTLVIAEKAFDIIKKKYALKDEL